MFDSHTLLLFWLKNKQTVHMFWLRDLRFVFWSRDLDELRVQRIIGFLSYLPTNQRGQNIEFQTVYPIFLKNCTPKMNIFM